MVQVYYAARKARRKAEVPRLLLARRAPMRLNRAMMKPLALMAAALFGLNAAVAMAEPGAAPFAGWSAVVIAGDYRATNGNPTKAFENARRDVAAALTRLGFSRANTIEMSVRPPEGEAGVTPAGSIKAIDNALLSLRRHATEGCLVYFTSHGDEGGVSLDEDKISPEQMNKLIRGACGQRPTILVISACHSGVFTEETLQAPNRMIFAAARRDRPSFGCSEDAVYPFFDACFLESTGGAKDFFDLTDKTRACVEKRESEMGLEASDPQLFVGEGIEPLLRAAVFPPSS